MIRRIATVGGLTLVSRLSGFIRDVVMAAILGAGPIADAFFVAFRRAKDAVSAAVDAQRAGAEIESVGVECRAGGDGGVEGVGRNRVIRGQAQRARLDARVAAPIIGGAEDEGAGAGLLQVASSTSGPVFDILSVRRPTLRCACR